MQRSKVLLIFIVSFLSGIVFGGFYLNGQLLKSFFALLFLFVLFFKTFDRLFFFVVIVVLIGFVLGFLRFSISLGLPYDHIKNYDGYFQFKGCIDEEVDVRSDKVKYTVDLYEIDDGGFKPVSGRVLVNAQRYPVYEYGDCLFVAGELKRPFSEEFDYAAYLSRYSIYRVVYYSEIEKIGERDSYFFGYIFKIKSEFEARLNRIFPEPYSGLMAGIILGSRRGINPQLMENFNATGLTHIVAISGYNVTLVILVIGGIFSFLSRRFKVVFSIVSVVLFVVLVGASASVVRAGIMGIISLLALWFGRQYYVFIALFASAFLMNLWNPKIALYDAGFQLSFLATFGIIIFSGRILKLFKWIPEFFGIRESFLMTLSAQVFALPLIVLNFGKLSLISPVANIFVLPLVPIAMLFGFFAVILSFASDVIGNIIGFFGYVILDIVIFFVEFFSAFDFSSVSVDFSWYFVFFYYFLLTIIINPLRFEV